MTNLAPFDSLAARSLLGALYDAWAFPTQEGFDFAAWAQGSGLASEEVDAAVAAVQDAGLTVMAHPRSRVALTTAGAIALEKSGEASPETVARARRLRVFLLRTMAERAEEVPPRRLDTNDRAIPRDLGHRAVDAQFVALLAMGLAEYVGGYVATEEGRRRVAEARRAVEGA